MTEQAKPAEPPRHPVGSVTEALSSVFIEAEGETDTTIRPARHPHLLASPPRPKPPNGEPPAK